MNNNNKVRSKTSNERKEKISNGIKENNKENKKKRSSSNNKNNNNNNKKFINNNKNFNTEPTFEEKFNKIKINNENINKKIQEKSLLLKYSKNKQSTFDEISKLMINDIKNNLSLI
jgi:hypothetical protein